MAARLNVARRRHRLSRSVSAAGGDAAGLDRHPFFLPADAASAHGVRAMTQERLCGRRRRRPDAKEAASPGSHAQRQAGRSCPSGQSGCPRHGAISGYLAARNGAYDVPDRLQRRVVVRSRTRLTAGRGAQGPKQRGDRLVTTFHAVI